MGWGGGDNYLVLKKTFQILQADTGGEWDPTKYDFNALSVWVYINDVNLLWWVSWIASVIRQVLHASFIISFLPQKAK